MKVDLDETWWMFFPLGFVHRFWRFWMNESTESSTPDSVWMVKDQ